MVTMNKLFKCDFLLYQDWLVFRQGKECGFQGRTNKLVDGCYSFWQVIFFYFLVLGIFMHHSWINKDKWQGGVFALLQRIPSVSKEQIVLPDVGKRCPLDSSHASTTSSMSEVSKSSEGTSSQVDDTGDFRQEGRLILTSFRCLAICTLCRNKLVFIPRWLFLCF